MPILDEYLKIYTIMQKYKKKRGDRFVYDYKRACENEPLLKGSYLLKRDGRIGLAKVLHRVDRDVKRGYIRMADSKNHLRGYIGAREIFGNIKGKKGYNFLFDEIRELIEKGENFKDHSRRLQWEYHKSKEIIEDLWNWISKDYKELTNIKRKNQISKKETSQLRDLRKFFKNTKPSEERTKESQAQEITEEEYKRRFGHYPDLGKK